MITELKPNQVFIYGMNRGAFHGAGAAGYAFSGTTANNWRTCPLKQAAINRPNYINTKTGRLNKIGRWNVWGSTDSYQIGYLGNSYGITTVEKPGGPKVSLKEIRDQFFVLIAFASGCKELEFLMTAVGTGYGGFTHEEVGREWRAAIDKFGCLPSNIVEIGKYV